MLRNLAEHARTLRALIAVCAAGALCVVLFVTERERNETKARAIYLANATLWKMSELIFESQRFSNELLAYEAGTASVDDVQLRFDILWSRLDVLEQSQVQGWGQIDNQLQAFRSLMVSEEPLIFSDAPLSPEESARLRAAVSRQGLDARRVWTDAFTGASPAIWAISATAVDELGSFTHVLTAGLISLLMLYVLAEIFFAGRAQKREHRLHEAAALASAAKSRFLANVSHEIRTPLNGILGMASELADSRLTDDQAQCLDVIEQSGGVLLNTINDVLDLSKVEAGAFQVEHRPFVLADTLEAARALYAATAREKGLTLSLQVQANLPRRVMGDERRLQQVMHNLIANAVKFTETGSVSIRAMPEVDGHGIVLSVRDTGPGIPLEARGRIFQPFAQADASISRQFGGTGLGLAISKQLCEAMGGSLSLLSRAGNGTTFYCSLPLQAAVEQEASEQTKTADQPPDLHGWQVLVADDNATNRLILTRFLKNTGAVLSYAESGAAAVELAADHEFDLILMDIQMPRMDGTAATRAIREMEQQRGRPGVTIVAVTANALNHQADEYRQSGMQDVLAKPVSKPELMALLHDLAELRRAA